MPPLMPDQDENEEEDEVIEGGMGQEGYGEGGGLAADTAGDGDM